MIIAMTRFLIGLALFILPAVSFAAERRYSVTDFDRIMVEGPYVVRLVTGGSSSAVASGPQAGIDRLSLDVNGRTLRIRRSRNHWGGTEGAAEGPIRIAVTTRQLRAARVIGPGLLQIDRVEGLRIDLTVEGSGRIDVARADADALSIGLAGAGTIALAGRSESLTADVQGSGNVEAAAFRADNLVVTTTTTGNVEVGAGRTAQVTALGLGSTRISGTPACTIRGPSAALVRCGSDQR